jgi:hypothetical protein
MSKEECTYCFGTKVYFNGEDYVPCKYCEEVKTKKDGDNKHTHTDVKKRRLNSK